MIIIVGMPAAAIILWAVAYFVLAIFDQPSYGKPKEKGWFGRAVDWVVFDKATKQRIKDAEAQRLSNAIAAREYKG